MGQKGLGNHRLSGDPITTAVLGMKKVMWGPHLGGFLVRWLGSDQH